MAGQEDTTGAGRHFERYRKGLRTATANNGSAFAYSIYVTIAFAVTQRRDPAELVDLYLFVLGAAAAFVVVEALVSKFFRVRLRGESSGVSMLGSAMSGFATAAALGASYAAAGWLSGPMRWLLSSFAGTLAFLGVLAVAMDLGRRLAERIPHEAEDEPSSPQQQQQ